MKDPSKGRGNTRITVTSLNLPTYTVKTTSKSYTQKTRRWALLVAFLTIFSLILVYTRSQYANLHENMPDIMASENESETIPKAKISPWRHGMVQVAHLDAKLLPREQSMDQTTGNDRRLIFIGDIHGCKRELLALLEKASYRRETDHIVSVGDVVNKGPDSEGVLDFLMNEGASCVRGNHEDKVLRLTAEAEGFSEAKHPKKAGSKKEVDTRALAKHISKAHLNVHSVLSTDLEYRPYQRVLQRNHSGPRRSRTWLEFTQTRPVSRHEYARYRYPRQHSLQRSRPKTRRTMVRSLGYTTNESVIRSESH